MKTSRKSTLILAICTVCVFICASFAGGVSAENRYSAQFGLEISAMDENELNVGVALTSNFEVTNGSFNLYYDTEALEFAGFDGDTAMMKKALYESNSDYTDTDGNKALRFCFASAYALPFKSGVLCYAKFKILKRGETKLFVKYCKIYDNSEVLQKYLPEDVFVPVFIGDFSETLNLSASSKYEADDEYIKGVSPNTKVGEFKANFTNKCIKVVGPDGNEKADDALVGTGTEVRVCTANGECATGVAYANIILKTFRTIVKGDADGNAKIDSTDTILLKRHMLKIASLEGAFLEAVDSDSNQKIDATDYLFVKRVILGIVKI